MKCNFSLKFLQRKAKQKFTKKTTVHEVIDIEFVPGL